MLQQLSTALQDPELLGNLESVVKMLAILVGGWWTYTRFIRVRERFPKARLTHHVTDRPLGKGKRLINVRGAIENIGLTAMRIREVETRVQQVEPLAPGELEKRIAEAKPHDVSASTHISWYSIGHRVTKFGRQDFHIEPNESDWIEYDFIVDEPVRRVRIYTFVTNEALRRARRLWRKSAPLGWRVASHHLITDSIPSKEDAMALTRRSVTAEEQALPEPLPEPRPSWPEPERKQGVPESVPPQRPVHPGQGVPETDPEPRPPNPPDSDDQS